MLKAFLFDMDGVLFDSMPKHAEAWYQIMGEHYGFACDRTFFYLCEGATGQQVIDDFFVEQRGRHAEPWEIEMIYKEKSRPSCKWARQNLCQALPMCFVK